MQLSQASSAKKPPSRTAASSEGERENGASSVVPWPESLETTSISKFGEAALPMQFLCQDMSKYYVGLA